MKAKVNWQKVEKMVHEMRDIDHADADRIMFRLEQNSDWYIRKGWTTEQVVARVVNLAEQRARRVSHDTGYFV